MQPAFDVLCLGFANHDMIAAVEGYPPPDSKNEVLDLLEQGGGPAATAAVAIARLGGRVALLAAVGDDQTGERVLREVAAEGVDASHCPRRQGAVTAVSLVIVDRSAATRAVFRYSGTMKLLPADVDPALVKSARVLLIDAHMPEAALAAASIARQGSIPVVLDSGEPKEGLGELMAVADYPAPTAAAARWLTGEQDVERAARSLLREPARAVVATMGAGGYVIATPEAVRREPAFLVDAVDTTGAGDAFHGGLALALAWGQPIEEAARFGAAVAALKCCKPGGRTGLPTLPEVEELLAHPRFR